MLQRRRPRDCHNRLACKKNCPQPKNANKPGDQWPFKIVQPSWNLLNAYSGRFAAALLRVSALLTLFRRSILVRQWRRSGYAHGHKRTRGNILTAIEIHVLFLSGRSQAIATDLHTGRRDNQQPAARINRWNLHRRRVSRIRQLVRITHRVPARPKRERNRVTIILLVDRKLYHRHSRRPCSGYLLQLAAFRQREIKTALAPEVSQRRLRLVLDLIFFTDNTVGALVLKNHHMGRNVDRLRVLGTLINIHLRGGCPRRDGLVEIDAVIHRAHEHRLRPESGVVESEFPLRAAFGTGDFLHPSLELDQDEIDSCRCLAGCAVHHRAVNRSRFGGSQRSKDERGEQSPPRGVKALHSAPPSPAPLPRHP